MLKKNIVFAALAGLAFTVNAPAPADAQCCAVGICNINHKHAGTGRGPSKKTAKWYARQKWRFGVLRHGHPRAILWRYSKDKSVSCSRKYGVYKCKAKAFPCEKGIDDGQIGSLRGVNLDRWCKKKVGRYFNAKLKGKTAGDWVCEFYNGRAKPVAISVEGACRLQYGRRKVRRAKALNWNDPYSWKCELRK